MPRLKLLRRFAPSYGVSMPAVEIEAKVLQSEVERMELQSASDVETRLNAVREKSKQCWDHLCLLTAGFSDREQLSSAVKPATRSFQEVPHGCR